jgi:TatD DNase family protein
MVTLIDTHAHLDYPELSQDLQGILARCEAAGVEKIIAVGTSIESSRRVIALAEQFEPIYAAVGVHPNNAVEAPDDIRSELRFLARHPKVAAIGETGLDYYRLPSRRQDSPAADVVQALGAQETGSTEDDTLDALVIQRQSSLFEQHLQVAADYGLNVIVHQRECWDEAVAAMESAKGKVRAVFHCFTGTLAQAQSVLDENHLVSFTGIVTFKNAEAIRGTAKSLPPGSFMVETDCPYLAPVPHRGERCEPSCVRHTAEFLATLRKVKLETLAEETTNAALKFFRFDRKA